MYCPICVEQHQKTRDTVEAKDMTGHLLSLHTKPEIAASFAKFMWSGNGNGKIEDKEEAA